MRLRRGTAPILYHLHQDDVDVGHVRRTSSNTIIVTFTGFGSSTAAATAAWLAHTGRAAYETGQTSKQADADTAELTTARDRDAFILRLRGAGVARGFPAFDSPGAPQWSVELELDGSTQEIFLPALVRRMWGGVRRAGLHAGGTGGMAWR